MPRSPSGTIVPPPPAGESFSGRGLAAKQTGGVLPSKKLMDRCVFVSVILERLSGAFLLNCELFALTLLFALPLGLVVAFVINYACYFSEIYRGGIEAVPKGQTEAGQVLGMTKPQIFFRVTLLQVIKRILPPMGNEIITLVKDTSLANTIANKEIIMMAKEYSAKGLIWPLFSTAIFFLVFVGVLTILFNWLEKKLDYFRC